MTFHMTALGDKTAQNILLHAQNSPDTCFLMV